MSNRLDAAILLDIATAARRAIGFAAECDEQSFLCDLKTQAAVQHQLLIIGEAVKQLSFDFRDSVPGVPWHQIAGMRDRLIHGYDTVNLSMVWYTVSKGVPDLLDAITPFLPVDQGK